MNVMHLTVNQLIQDVCTKENYRILWLNDSENYCYWISLGEKKTVPQKIALSTIQEGLDKREYVFPQDNLIYTSSTHQPSETAIKNRDIAWNAISDLVEKQPEIYEKKSRSSLLKSASEKSGMQVPNLYKNLIRYWRGGMTPNALLPKYENCGNSTSMYAESAKRRGKKKVEGAEGKTLTTKDLEIFAQSIKTWYLSSEKTSLEKTYTNMLGFYYTQKDAEGNPLPFSPDSVPSRNQFYYWHSRHKNELEEARARDGERKYPLEYRGSVERTETYLSGPCSSAQIDATIADIFLVRQDDRSAIVGRPIMYFLMDSFSRMVIGMHISLEYPSWTVASLSIMNALEDKTEYCRKYGVAITHDEWPCMNPPNILVADRGEMESRIADILVNDLGIRLENMPPYRGDLKGIIERHFKTIHLDLSDVPGKMDVDFGERCSEDYRMNARLDINQFTAIVIRCVLTYNNYHYMEYYEKSMQMRQMHVKPVPRDLWNFGIRHLSGGQRVLSKAHVKFALLPSSTASITPNGIQFKGLYYGCEKAFKERWFDSARAEGHRSVTVSYDPRDASSIYIRTSSVEEPIECSLLRRSKIEGKLSTTEIDEMNRYDHEEYERFRPTEDYQTILAGQKITEIINQANDMFPQHIDQSHAQRIRSIAENRKAEIEAQHEKLSQLQNEDGPESLLYTHQSTSQNGSTSSTQGTEERETKTDSQASAISDNTDQQQATAVETVEEELTPMQKLLTEQLKKALGGQK